MEGWPFYLTAGFTDADVHFVIRAFRESIAELQNADSLNWGNGATPSYGSSTCELKSDSSICNNRLIDKGMTRHWLEAFFKTLLHAVENPAVKVDDLRLHDADTLANLDAWSEGRPTPVDGAVTDYFQEACREYSQKVALSWKGGSWTYADFAIRVSSMANELMGRGVKAGDRVAIQVTPGPDLMVSIMGVLEAGAVYVPMERSTPEARRSEILSDAECVLIIADAEVRRVETIVPSQVRQAADGQSRVSRYPDDAAYVIYTSGSTGKPKGVECTHRGIIRLVKYCDYCNLGPEETILQITAVAFDASVFEIFGALLNGGRLVLMNSSEPSLEEIADIVADQEVTTMWLTSGLFELMVEEQLDSLGGLNQFLSGGDVVSPRHAKMVHEAHPQTKLINGYGPTENAVFTTVHVITEEDLDGSALPIGKVIAGTFVDIVDEAGGKMPVGVPGELRCGGGGLALGYLNRPELTAERFVQTERGRMYRTGDLCRWESNGTISYLGRMDRQVKLRGFRIELGEIECALMDHPAVNQAKVDVRGGDVENSPAKRLLAWYTIAEACDVSAGELASWLADRLPRYMLPDRIAAVDSMPLNANGKISVQELAEPSAVQLTGRREPKGEIERCLATIWCELIGIEQLGRDDDFFDLGGNSLSGMRMLSRIRKEFGVAFPLSALFRMKTVRALATAIDRGAETGRSELTVSSSGELACVQPLGDLPPIFAIHGGDGGILFYRELAERLPKDRPFYAIESPDLGHSGEIELGSVEETATRYLEILKAERPKGPWILAGYSYGGVVAYEMARQLEAGGEQVAMLGLFDTENPAIEIRPYDFTERVSVYWKAQSDKPLIDRLAAMASRFRGGVETHFRVKSEVAEARKAAAAEAYTELRAIQLREAHGAVMDAFKPKPLGGALTLFRASGVNDKFAVPDDYGWESMVGSLTVVEVPGKHLTLFEPGNVGLLADAFLSAIGSENSARN